VQVFSPTPLHALEIAPVKHTKSGASKKHGAKSHYSTEHYAPQKGEKPVSEPKPKGWAHAYSPPADHEEVPDLPKSNSGPSAAKANSHYSAEKYTPKKGEKPAPKTKEVTSWGRTDVKPKEMIKNAEELLYEDKADWNSTLVKKDKLSTIESSGYGVISPVRCSVFRQDFALEDVIGSHACSLEALTCV